VILGGTVPVPISIRGTIMIGLGKVVFGGTLPLVSQVFAHDSGVSGDPAI
jgi:hypothetical protein